MAEITSKLCKICNIVKPINDFKTIETEPPCYPDNCRVYEDSLYDDNIETKLFNPIEVEDNRTVKTYVCYQCWLEKPEREFVPWKIMPVCINCHSKNIES